METFSIEYALLAMQRALLDVVTPDLRAVDINIYKEKKTMYVRFYYDGEASEELIELWHCAIAEGSASLGPDCFVDDGVERLDYPQPIPLCGSYMYLRKE